MFSLGIVYFVPSIFFFNTLRKDKWFFWSPPFVESLITISEWYEPKYSEYLITFDSWEDLKKKVNTLDYENHKSKLIEYGKKHEKDVCEKWNNVLKKLK
jgi:hypothetical protein